MTLLASADCLVTTLIKSYTLMRGGVSAAFLMLPTLLELRKNDDASISGI